MSEMRGGQEDEEDGAAQAFEALRAEVAQLRQGIERVYRQGQEARAEPKGGGPNVDYSLTLGQMQKSLQAMQGRLDTIEGKPALAMTPEDYRLKVEEVSWAVGRKIGDAMREAAAEQRKASAELKETLGQARDKREQRDWVIAISFASILTGMALFMVLIRVLPWGGGTWLAANAIAGGKWDAGLELLHEASPADYARMTVLDTICGGQPLEFCARAIAEKTLDSAKSAP